MFKNSVFNKDIGTWSIQKVNDLSDMFNGATSFNQPLSGGNYWRNCKIGIGTHSSVTSVNLSGMFKNSSFNQNIENWNVNKVTNFSEMFKDNTAFDQSINWGKKINEDANLTEMFANTIINNSSLLSFNQKIKNREGYATMFSGNEIVALKTRALHIKIYNPTIQMIQMIQVHHKVRKREDSDSGNFKPANKYLS